MASKTPRRAPAECPVCGTAVPRNAKSCPQCGADERTGWNDEATRYDGLDLPEEAFDYEETLQEEGLKPRLRPRGLSGFWWLVGSALTALVIYRVLHGRFL